METMSGRTLSNFNQTNSSSNQIFSVTQLKHIKNIYKLKPKKRELNDYFSTRPHTGTVLPRDEYYQVKESQHNNTNSIKPLSSCLPKRATTAQGYIFIFIFYYF